jgi:23S rRNA (cytidine1920-2'-O)/16S rRNA (cytidine1409-2'-O)-methyltransferase
VRSGKARLDEIVAERAGVTRARARALIMEGRVSIDGGRALKPGQSVRENASVEIVRPRRFVSRGGEKLDSALDAFGIDVRSMEALDVGSSTGGFTDCLLQRGAARVTALDVGYGQIDLRLRNDARVRVVERTNFRLLSDDAFLNGFDLITIDASFISLRPMLARAVNYLRPCGAIVALVKPQFEAGRASVRRGVVRDVAVHRRVIEEVVAFARALSLIATGLVASPLRGPAGNREFFLELRREGTAIDAKRLAEVVYEA